MADVNVAFTLNIDKPVNFPGADLTLPSAGWQNIILYYLTASVKPPPGWWLGVGPDITTHTPTTTDTPVITYPKRSEANIVLWLRPKRKVMYDLLKQLEQRGGQGG